MSKKKSKSYVQMKEEKTKNEEHDILNPLKEYEYIEPKKQFPIKQVLLIFFSIVTILLIIIFFIIIDKKNEEISTKENNNNQHNTESIKTTTNSNKTINENITDVLICHSTNVEGDLQIETQVTANFYQNQLKSDINYMSIRLTNENSRDQFDNYVTILQMFSIYLADDETYEVAESTTDDEFIISIKTTYSEDKVIDSNLTYNESYESVKQKLIELGHTCE